MHIDKTQNGLCMMHNFAPSLCHFQTFQCFFVLNGIIFVKTLLNINEIKGNKSENMKPISNQDIKYFLTMQGDGKYVVRWTRFGICSKVTELI